MSLGPLMLDIAGTELSAEDREVLQHPHVGGVILFTRNYASPQQLQQLTREIHALRNPKLLIAVDQEGGRVQRFHDGFTLLPAAARLGETFDHDHARGKYLSRLAGWLMAAELLALEVDFSFAPVLDVDHGVSEVIGSRAFHRQPEHVAELTHAYMQGMHEAGMAATGKHFPGHGAVTADSHHAIPVDKREYNDIYAHDILPFRKMIGYGLNAVMPAHVTYSRVDKLPAGFSPFWLQDVLRSRLRFQGVIFSDDLDMRGASSVGEAYIDRARAALQAGCDMVLVCNNRPAALQVLEQLGDYNDPVAHLRLVRMHGKIGAGMDQLHASRKWREAVSRLEKYLDNPTLAFDF